MDLIFRLSNVQILKTQDGVRRLVSRNELSQNSLEIVLRVERYLRNRADCSKAKIDQMCREILPQP